MKKSKPVMPEAAISLLCYKCKEVKSENKFYARWVKDAKEHGGEAICLDCMEKIGGYTCKSCGEKKSPENFSLAGATDWQGKRKNSLRHVLSERCFNCRIRDMEAGRVKTPQEKEQLKALRAARLSAVAQEAKRRGMTYGQYQAYLYCEAERVGALGK